MTDTHFDVNSSRLDDLQATIINKLNQVAEITRTEKIDLWLHGGDLSNKPDVSRILTGEVAKAIRAIGKPMYVVPGSHDVYGYSLNTLPNSMLGLLYSTGVVKLLYRGNPLKINVGGKSIVIEGQEHTKNCELDLNSFRTDIKGDFNILIPHCMLLKENLMAHTGEPVALTSQVALATGANVVLSGHYHDGFDAHEIAGVKFFNPGSLLRTDAIQSNKTRIPKVLILEINDGALTNFYYKELRVSDGKLLFDYGINLKKNQNTKTLDAFQQQLNSVNTKSINVLDTIDEVANSINEDASIVAIAKNAVNKNHMALNSNGYVEAKDNVFLESFEIENFQSHIGKKKIDLVDGLNIFQGPSNNGKTAMFRGLGWALFDDMSGNDFISTGQNKASVKLNLSNKTSILRKRNKSGGAGEYELTNSDGTISSFTGFSNRLPIEIQNAHQIPTLVINKEKYILNYAEQLAPAFLVAGSSTEKLNLLGSIVGSESADLAVKDLNKEKRDNDAVLKVQKDNIALKEKSLESYSGLDKTLSVIAAVEKYIMVSETKDKELEDLKVLKNVYDINFNVVNDAASDIKNIELKLSSLSFEVVKFKELFNEIEVLNNIYVDIAFLNGNISVLKDKLNQPSLDINIVNELKSKVYELDEILSLQEDYNNYTDAISKINIFDPSELKKYGEEYKNYILEVENLKNIDGEYSMYSYNCSITNKEIKNIDAGIIATNNSLSSLKIAIKLQLTEQGKCETCGGDLTAEQMDYMINNK